MFGGPATPLPERPVSFWSGGRLALLFAVGGAGVDLLLAGRLGPAAQAATFVGVAWCALGDALSVALAVQVHRWANVGTRAIGERGLGPPIDAGLVLAALFMLPLGFGLGHAGEALLTTTFGQAGHAEIAGEYLSARAVAFGVGAAHLMWLAGDVARGDPGHAAAIGLVRLLLHAAFAWMLGWGGLGAQARGPGGLGAASVLASVGAVLVHGMLLLARPALRRSTGLLSVDSLRLAPWGPMLRGWALGSLGPLAVAGLWLLLSLLAVGHDVRTGAVVGLCSWFLLAGVLLHPGGPAKVRAALWTTIVGTILWFSSPLWSRWFASDSITARGIWIGALPTVVLVAILGPLLAPRLRRSLGTGSDGDDDP